MIKFISVPGNAQAEKLWLTQKKGGGEEGRKEQQQQKRIQQSCNGMNAILEWACTNTEVVP